MALVDPFTVLNGVEILTRFMVFRLAEDDNEVYDMGSEDVQIDTPYGSYRKQPDAQISLERLKVSTLALSHELYMGSCHAGYAMSLHSRV